MRFDRQNSMMMMAMHMCRMCMVSHTQKSASPGGSSSV